MCLAPSPNAGLVVHMITDLDIGGAERMLTNYLVARPKNGANHIVVSLMSEGHFKKVLTAQGIEVLEIGIRSPWLAWLALFRLARMLRTLRPAVVVGWMYHANLAASLSLWLCGRRQRTRLIWGIRCSAMQLTRYRWSLRFVVRFSALLSRSPDLIVYNSVAGRTEHEESGFRGSQVAIAHNGIDTKVFRPDSEARLSVRAELGIPAEAFVIIVAARVDPMKGYETLFAALGHIPEEPYVIITGKDTIEKLPNGPRVKCLGAREDMPRLYAAADALVLASAFGEGFPNVVAEGMACGLIPIVTDTGDAKIIVGDAGIVVPPCNATALASAIRLIRKEPLEAYQERSRRARLRIEQMFSIAEVIPNLESLFTPKG